MHAARDKCTKGGGVIRGGNVIVICRCTFMSAGRSGSKFNINALVFGICEKNTRYGLPTKLKTACRTNQQYFSAGDEHESLSVLSWRYHWSADVEAPLHRFFPKPLPYKSSKAHFQVAAACVVIQGLDCYLQFEMQVVRQPCTSSSPLSPARDRS